MRIGGCLVVLLLLLSTATPVQAGVGLPEIGSLQIGSYRARLLNDSAGLRTGTNTLTVHIPDLPPGAGVPLRLQGPGGERIDVPLRPLRVLGGLEGRHAVVTVAPVALAHGSTASAADTPGPAPERYAGSDDHAGHRDQQAHREPPAGEKTGHTHAGSGPGHGPDVSGGSAEPPAGEKTGHTHAGGGPGHGPDVSAGSAGGAHAPDGTTHAGDTRGEAPGGHGTGAHGGDVFAGFAARGAARLPATGVWRAVLTVGDGRVEPLTGELVLRVTTDGPNVLYLGFLGFLSGGSVLYGWIHRRRSESRH